MPNTKPLASQIRYPGPGALATRTADDKMRERVSAIDFGADSSGVADSSAAIISALAASDHVYVPPGMYRCDTMIQITSYKALELAAGTTLKRMSANSSSVDPVVWLNGFGSSLFGAGQLTSFIKSENRAPRGVVSLGHKDMTQSHGNVLWCNLQNLNISGALGYGQTTGNPDAALYMANPQFSDLASYFHNVTGLMLQNANYGLWLCGWANANTISNIQGSYIGNTTLGANKNAFIYCNGALDNAMSDVFFHFSDNSIGLLVDTLDNSSNGGVVHTPFANSFKGLVFEQGGASAYGAKIYSGAGCYYETRSNCAFGDYIYSGFYDQNLLVGLGATNYNIGSMAKTRSNINQSGVKNGEEKYLTYGGLVENTTYKILDIPITNSFGGMLEVDFSSDFFFGIPMMGGGKVVYQFANNGGTLTASAILSRFSGGIRPCVPIISGTTASIVFKVDNNGTGTAGGQLSVNLRFVNPSNTPTYYSTLTTSGTVGTALANNI